MDENQTLIPSAKEAIYGSKDKIRDNLNFIGVNLDNLTNKLNWTDSQKQLHEAEITAKRNSWSSSLSTPQEILNLVESTRTLLNSFN